jgi:hypothetical protein
MLQRIQSIYLLFAALVIAALFVFPLVHDVFVDGQNVTIKVTGIYTYINGQANQVLNFLPLTIATIVVAVMPLAIIFMYRDRKRQIMLCYGAMGIILAYSYWVSASVKNAIGGADLQMSNYGIGIILLSLAIFLIVFAQKAIQKDEKLVRSADRLR